MNNKGVGAVFCLIAALLMAAKYLAAAIFMSGVVSWSGELFRSGLEYVGSPLSIAAGIALAGMYLLCMEERFGLSKGDMFCVFCALAFPFQILAVEIFAQRTDPVFLSCVQFLTVSLIAFFFALIFEKPELGALKGTLVPLLYAGLMSGAVAYTLQVVGQEKMRNPSAASLIMSLESVFAALAGFILLHQTMTPRKIIGCAVMFAAIILAQI